MLGHFEAEKLPASVINRIEVIFEEVVLNIIRHGFQPNSDQQIFIHVDALPGALHLVFEDDGIPFNPLSVPPPPSRFESLETAKIGGLGVHLVTRLSMNAQYRRVACRESVRWHCGRLVCPNNRLTLLIGKQ